MSASIRVDDPLQPGYSYELSAREGQDFDADFQPELTPKQMLELGIFGGIYFAGHVDEYPKSWFTHAKIADSYDAKLNFFGVKASQPLAEWQRKGWIYPEDPRGWFQWYCRYYLGRRIPEEDTRQIKRWRAIRRHIVQIERSCTKGDWNCHTKQRQAVLHWAYDARKL